MKAIVTGGAGFVGSHLAEALISDGAYVVTIDNYSRGNSRNLNVARYKRGILEVRCDVRDKEGMRPHFEGADWVFHGAALKNFLCTDDPKLGMEINEGGTINVLELSVEVGVKRFVYASSASVYGPSSAYAVSKRAAEGYVQMFHRHYELDTTILRYFHVYGPRCNASEKTGDVIPKFIRRLYHDMPLHIHGDGSQERAYTYVGDIVTANLLAVKSEEATGEIYNCTSGIKVTIREMADRLRTLMEKEHIKIVHDEWRVGDTRVVHQVSGSEIGPASWISFEKGLEKTVEWYLGEGRWAIC